MQQVLPPQGLDDDFASRVLARIGEGPPATITNAADYLLTLLYSQDVQTRSYNFNRLLDRKYGRPPQGILISDNRDFSSNPSERIAELLALGRRRLAAGIKPN